MAHSEGIEPSQSVLETNSPALEHCCIKIVPAPPSRTTLYMVLFIIEVGVCTYDYKRHRDFFVGFGFPAPTYKFLCSPHRQSVDISPYLLGFALCVSGVANSSSDLRRTSYSDGSITKYNWIENLIHFRGDFSYRLHVHCALCFAITYRGSSFSFRNLRLSKLY